MALVTLKEILSGCKQGGYGVGAFNFNGLEDSIGMINGAVKMNSKIILMASMSAAKYIGVKTCANMIKGMAESVDIPVCLHLDHATDIDFIKECVDAGFTSVMIDASKKEFEENIKETAEVVKYAHSKNCSVEAELGKLGGREENVVVEDREAMFTNPKDVPEFVERTGIDALAIAFGTAHGFYKAEPNLDFELIEKIANITDVPLVMHGGTGVPVEGFKKAIACGISKVNVGTELKATYVQALRDAMKANPEEGDPRNYMKDVKTRCEEVVKGKIEIFGCAGK